MPKFFTPSEVSCHNTLDDLWVSFLGEVCDLTPLMKQFKGDVLLMPIAECAGKDISHWFDPDTKDIQTHIDPVTGCRKYYTPRGRFVHVPPSCPRTDWANDFGYPWWKDPQYVVGLLTAKTRWIRIINTLTKQEQRLEVCSEETLQEILRRYLRCNSNASTYTWKHDGAPLDMDKTLGQNGLADEDGDLHRLRVDPDLYTPGILLYYNYHLPYDP